ncbi:unnamed protein product [Caenorhabditis angaria]|uniref:Uncharacterized protein n=1 Tax=Caenorhabditis angaria TaxID=860376 RepID=A0A9P1MTG8_9PELO|nr:unnamed protein product [Caenorhabditis angaria]
MIRKSNKTPVPFTVFFSNFLTWPLLESEISSKMSDNIGPFELSQAFKFLLAAQLETIAIDGVMPSTHGALSKLLCSCYSKDAEVTDFYQPKTTEEDPENSTTTTTIVEQKKIEKFPKKIAVVEEKKENPIIVEVYDDTMMISTRPNNNNSNNNNRTMIIEDVTDDPEYSSYGNENQEPKEEGAFIEYEKLDKMENPAVFQVGHSTTAINRTYNNIIGTGARSGFRMPTSNSGTKNLDLKDVEDGAKCRIRECRLGWKQHAWR